MADAHNIVEEMVASPAKKVVKKQSSPSMDLSTVESSESSYKKYLHPSLMQCLECLEDMRTIHNLVVHSCNRDENLLSEGSDMKPGTVTVKELPVTVKELPVTVKESVLYHSSFLPFGDFRYF